MLAEWAAEKLGITGAALEDYVKAVRKADLAEKGDDDVFRKVKQDFADKGVAITDAEIRTAMGQFLWQSRLRYRGRQQVAQAEPQARTAEMRAAASRGQRRSRFLRRKPAQEASEAQDALGPWPVPRLAVDVAHVAALDDRGTPTLTRTGAHV